MSSDGRLVAWGGGADGQLEVTVLTVGERYTAVVTGGVHNLAIAEAFPTYVVDLTHAPTGQALWEVRVGRGITYGGTGTPERDPVRVLGQRRSGGELIPGHAVRAVGGKLTVVTPGTDRPNPGGGLIDLKFAPLFGDADVGEKVVPLRLSVTGVMQGAYLALTADG